MILYLYNILYVLKGWTLLHVACGSDYKNAKIWKDTVIDFNIFKECLDANPAHISKRDKKGNIPLHYAMAKGDLVVIKYLLSIGNNDLMNEMNDKGQTPMVYASSFSDESNAKRAECIKYLVEQRAETYHRDQEGENVLSYMKKNQYPCDDLVEQLERSNDENDTTNEISQD